MHERKTLVVRNPRKPIPERVPCRLTQAEKLAKMERRMGIERGVDDLDARIASIKSKAKAEVSLVEDERSQLTTEMRTLREAIVDGIEHRMVDCELLEDIETGSLYVLRLDTMEVVQRRDMAPHELKARREAPELPLGERVVRTVEIPEDVASVRRFDSDVAGVGDESGEEDEDGEGEGEGEEVEHEHSWNEGACITCGIIEHDTEKPTRRKRGEGKRKDRGAETAGAEVH